ncbi:MAG: hypothetical protein QXT69_03075, partial [Fervidicoccaceae archaeon]
LDPSFYDRAVEKKGGIIVGGENYGQGSSREHAAIVPRYLGIRVVMARSFARIHRQNLVNFGVVPLIFTSTEDYNSVQKGDRIRIELGKLESREVKAHLIGKERTISLKHDLSEKEREVILAGGLLPWIRLNFS